MSKAKDTETNGTGKLQKRGDAAQKPEDAVKAVPLRGGDQQLSDNSIRAGGERDTSQATGTDNASGDATDETRARAGNNQPDADLRVTAQTGELPKEAGPARTDVEIAKAELAASGLEVEQAPGTAEDVTAGARSMAEAAKAVSDAAHAPAAQASTAAPNPRASEPPPVLGLPTLGKDTASSRPSDEQLTESEKEQDYVLALVPRTFRLRVNGATRVIEQGTRKLPRDLATHWYAKDNGVTIVEQ